MHIMDINQIELQRIKNIVGNTIQRAWNNKKSLSRLQLIIVGVQELKRQINSSTDKSVKQITVKELQGISIDIVKKLIAKKQIRLSS